MWIRAKMVARMTMKPTTTVMSLLVEISQGAMPPKMIAITIKTAVPTYMSFKIFLLTKKILSLKPPQLTTFDAWS